MKERGIIFSGPMVRAILDGRKTVTRRIIKPQPRWVESSGRWSYDIPKSRRKKGCCTFVCDASRRWWEYLLLDQWEYQVGQKLWARETWQLFDIFHDDWNGGYDGETWSAPIPKKKPSQNYMLQYQADGMSDCDHWRPSIHMPKWASRIWLEVVSVRPERLTEITEEDAKAEGVEPWQHDPRQPMTTGELGSLCPYRGGFACLWDDLHPDGPTWKDGPWVWRVEFKQVQNREAT